MNWYEKLGVKPLINGEAVASRLGGTLLPKEVRDAMEDAASSFVDMHDLQRKVGARIAELTNNEAAYVCSSASAGVVLAAAACMTGTDRARVGALPDSEGFPNEIIVHTSHRNPYEDAIRLAGAKIVGIGYVNQTEGWQLEAAINSNTAGVFYFYPRGGTQLEHAALPLEEVIQIAHRHGVPVVVDAAPILPPVENLWRYTAMGADLAIFSGGKGLQGPQSTGLIVGRRDLIDAVTMNGSPYYVMGRPMKVSKENMIGLLAAVERYLKLDHAAIKQEQEAMVANLIERLSRLEGISARRVIPGVFGMDVPVCHIELTDKSGAAARRNEIIQQLRRLQPPIYVGPAGVDTIEVNPQTLTAGQEVLIADALCTVIPAVLGTSDPNATATTAGSSR